MVVGWVQQRDFTGLLGMTFGIGAITFTVQSRRESRKLEANRLIELQEAHSELQKTHEQLQETTVLALQATANAERVKIAREIHDGVGHELTSLIVSLQAIDIMLPKDVMEAKNRLPEVIATARNAVREVRQAVRDWTDEDTEQQFAITGIEGLIRHYAHRADLTLYFTNQTPTYVWSAPQCLLIYRILQEAVTNVVRHAKATTVWIAMIFEESTLIITISDNGWFNGETLIFGFGLTQMKKRMQEVKGSLFYRQRDEHGLTLECKIPIDEGVMKNDTSTARG
jgi:signal transduction histidine kinase